MVRRIFFVLAVTVPATLFLISLAWKPILWGFVLVGPLLLVGLHDITQRRRALLRIYPVLGHGRYLMEEVRPEIQQYFVESNTDGRPLSREIRSVVYQRSKGVIDTLPFGTQGNVREVGYEWMSHSLSPRHAPDQVPRVRIGGPQCSQPYDASFLNISAMSFGALSKTAITALNRGAARGGFYHNTGEGGISPYHKEGGDLVWQIGTSYFGCRTPDGRFDSELFARKAQYDGVKMIEIKLSQGAKPGHGGVLPAAKLSAEIAEIRGVPLGEDVLSPPAHSAFDSPRGLLSFVQQLRKLSGGKPVGFKLCVGYPREFLAICKAMRETGVLPDFITVDGAEGGTGAAPLEYSNSVGMPLREGLYLVHNTLRGIGVRQHVKIIAAAKVATGFDMVRCVALGADLCNSARAMMLTLGCIQARRCNSNDCPVGVATQDPDRYKALNVEIKTDRVANFHAATVTSFLELVGTAGLAQPRDLKPEHIFHRISDTKVVTLEQLYPTMPWGCLLDPVHVPERWREPWSRACAADWNADSAPDQVDEAASPSTAQEPVLSG